MTAYLSVKRKTLFRHMYSSSSQISLANKVPYPNARAPKFRAYLTWALSSLKGELPEAFSMTHLTMNKAI